MLFAGRFFYRTPHSRKPLFAAEGVTQEKFLNRVSARRIARGGIFMRNRRSLVCVLLAALLSLAFVFPGCSSDNGGDENVLKVGMECGYQPYNWTQLTDEDGAVPIQGRKGQYANGYDVKIAKRIAEGLGKTLQVYAYEWDSLIPAVQSGALDLIIAGMSPTDERKEKVDFSEPYFNSNLVIVVRKDSAYASATTLADFSGAKIVAQSATFHDTVVDQIPDVNHVTPMEDFPTMITALKSNAVDGYIAEEPGATADCNANSEFTYIRFVNNGENGTGFTVEDLSNVTLAVGIRKGSSLLASVNEIIAAIPESERLSIMNEAVAAAERFASEA